ncbi:MAG: aldehyde-activating protein [Curvibacter sp. RIFCSPHIGHO2_12_FULL_63_18]|uniref:GFA family protein n=1 Tax=Rhodoferax sp. TaxID=50421 RepID=UPI0008D0C242|nr:GFA family protein [Rhodoferax sp.]OGO94784.1 MAG: aldehyde-activating protein [Curvibacter sp. GWA2_63_95]OGP06817.1 MAG: aldehyde-activating protein [Curvibacter sp. RIFCSPHIGHO2_12_FULL_63_18]HCX80287.1 aldehyde-activating protein [Rhodoferax sp.]
MNQTYQGSCHCGQIAFEVEGELTGAVDCNCSICQRKGTLMWFVPRAQLRLLTPTENLRSYTFHKHVIRHHFCPTCGMHPFGEGVGPDGAAMAAVNIRCLEGVDIYDIAVHHHNGRAL